jgi:hypothetical protein
MTHDPDNPERDPVLDAAWRDLSTEMPPARLDAAILAAAHRATGGVPQPVVTQETGKGPAEDGVKTRAATGPAALVDAAGGRGDHRRRCAGHPADDAAT